MQRFSHGDAVTAFGPSMAAVGEVELEESFELDTADCYGGQLATEHDLRPGIDMARFNRATGPIRVHGVRAGDWVAIEVEAIEIATAGVMALAPGLGTLGAHIEHASTRIVPIERGTAWITPTTGVPVQPMIGVLGVATEREPVPTSTPGPHGGNLDTRILTAGTALCVRANQDGLLLAAGDLHAAQGDGELGGTGVEIAGRVRLRVRAMAHEGSLPVVRTADGIAVLASAPTVDEAIRSAFAEAVALMARWHALAWDDAYRLTSVVGRAQVSQVVNPLRTARIAIDAAWSRLGHEVVA